MPVLVQELLTLYARGGEPGSLPRVTPYRDYLAWLAGQDRAAALAAWRDALAGLEGATHLAPPDRGRVAAGAGTDHAGVERAAERGAEPAGAVGGVDAQHADPGRVGDPAGSSERSRGRGVRGDGGGSAAGDRRHRAHDRAVHQHAAAAAAAAAVAAADWAVAGAAGAPVAADGAPASRACGDPGCWPGVGELFDTLVVFENYPVERGRLEAAAGESAAERRSRGTTRRTIRSIWRSSRASGSSCGSTIGRTCLIGPAWRRWRRGWSVCWGRRLPTPTVRSAALTSCRRSERRTILQEWNATARAIAPATLPSCLRRRWRAARRRWRLCTRIAAELPRARCALQPAGASPSRARGRPRGGGRAVRGALAGDDRGASGHPQGGGRVSSARSRLPGGAAGVHAGGCRRRRCW